MLRGEWSILRPSDTDAQRSEVYLYISLICSLKYHFWGVTRSPCPHPCFLRVSNKLLYAESPLDYKIKPVNPKGNQTWISTGRTDAEAETPILWPPDAKSGLIGKDPDAGKD